MYKISSTAMSIYSKIGLFIQKKNIDKLVVFIDEKMSVITNILKL